ncbi:conserved hypothetical protein [Ricinus communis]|uniref:Uncharacterized protein n=1 Tax=Ricinus communis TaxID=3988 RepID=B9S5M7_RICCO|nr:conserved hypothetical protein [Ricinus communis]
MKRSLEANDIVGIRSYKSIRLLEVQKGGLENLGCLPKHCRNFIESRLDDSDVEAIRKLFLSMQQNDRDLSI